MTLRCHALLPALVLLISPSAWIHAEDFSFARLRETARAMAAAPCAAPYQELDACWNNLTYDQHRDVRFKMEAGLRAKQQAPFAIDFFHPGWTAKKMAATGKAVSERWVCLWMRPN